MIVCVCHRISERDIQRQVGGCASFDELQMETGVATSCGRCGDCAQRVFHEAQHALAARPSVRREFRISVFAQTTQAGA